MIMTASVAKPRDENLMNTPQLLTESFGGSLDVLFEDVTLKDLLLSMGCEVADVEAADVPWSEAVVMICTKCSRKIVGNEDLADSMKKTLKHAFKEAGFGKSVRSVTSSCLDICPKDRVAIAVVRRHAGTRAVNVHPKIDAKTLFSEVRKLAVHEAR
jgi:hypothetical protein